jgi:hypothetical protein
MKCVCVFKEKRKEASVMKQSLSAFCIRTHVMSWISCVVRDGEPQRNDINLIIEWSEERFFRRIVKRKE